MKRVICVISVILALSNIFSVAPVSPYIGRLEIEVEEGSNMEKALKAFHSELDDMWFETYTTCEKALIDTYFQPLKEILPLENVVASSERDGALSLYDLDKKVRVSLVYGEEGLIKALLIEKQDSSDKK